jgi:hypothetical protein
VVNEEPRQPPREEYDKTADVQVASYLANSNVVWTLSDEPNAVVVAAVVKTSVECLHHSFLVSALYKIFYHPKWNSVVTEHPHKSFLTSRSTTSDTLSHRLSNFPKYRLLLHIPMYKK